MAVDTQQHSRGVAPQLAPAPRERGAQGNTVLIVLALTGIVVSLQQTLMIPLLPDMPRLLDTSAENASWLVSATLVSGAVATPTLTRLADMFGKKRMLMVALAWMIAGSCLGALGDGLTVLVAARAMQGIGVAAIPVGIAIMRDELPPDRVPLGVALMSATLAIGAGVGLPLAGYFATYHDWHAIFWVSAVVGAVLLTLVWRLLAESEVRTRGSFDFPGAIVLSGVLTTGFLALSKGGHWGWSDATTVGLVGLSLVLLAAWVPLELRTSNPLVDLRTASRPGVLLVNVAAVLGGFAMFSNMLVSTQLLYAPPETGYGLGLDLLETGVWMAPSALTFGAMAPIAAKVTTRYGPLATLICGALGMAVAYVARVFLSHELWQVVAGSMLVAAGTSLLYAAMPILIMRVVPVTETASANGLNTLLRSVGTSASSATMAAVVSVGAVGLGGGVFPSLYALNSVFWISAATSLVAGLVVLPLRGQAVGVTDGSGPGERRLDAVAQGRLLDSDARAIRHAIVTIVTPAGEQVDWSQTDGAGEFSVAVPGEGRYLMVVATPGWRPHAEIVDVSADGRIGDVRLLDRLTLSGAVAANGIAAAGATVVLTRGSGEVAASVKTSLEGTFSMPLPVNGSYSIAATLGSAANAQGVVVWGQPLRVQLELC